MARSIKQRAPNKTPEESKGLHPQAHIRYVMPDGHIDWNGPAAEIVTYLAAGYSDTDLQRKMGVSRMTTWRLRQVPEFAEELDKLTLVSGISARAERMRLAMRVVRKLEKDAFEKNKIGDTLLDWVKFAQSETDGAQLSLNFEQFFASIRANGGAVARPRPTSLPPLSVLDDDEDDEWDDGTGDPIR